MLSDSLYSFAKVETKVVSRKMRGHDKRQGPCQEALCTHTLLLAAPKVRVVDSCTLGAELQQCGSVFARKT